MKGEGKIKEKYYEIITITSNNFRNFAIGNGEITPSRQIKKQVSIILLSTIRNFATPINKGKNNKKNDNYEYYKSHHHQVLSQ